MARTPQSNDTPGNGPEESRGLQDRLRDRDLDAFRLGQLKARLDGVMHECDDLLAAGLDPEIRILAAIELEAAIQALQAVARQLRDEGEVLR